MTTMQHSDSDRLSGVDALAVRLGLALAKWGRVRAERGTIDHERAASRIRTDNTVADRERAAHRYGIAN